MIITMHRNFAGRLAHLQLVHPELARYVEPVIVNALCIDFIYGGAYAWAYLARQHVDEDDIWTMLRSPGRHWQLPELDVEQTADIALASAGLQHP